MTMSQIANIEIEKIRQTWAEDARWRGIGRPSGA